MNKRICIFGLVLLIIGAMLGFIPGLISFVLAPILFIVGFVVIVIGGFMDGQSRRTRAEEKSEEAEQLEETRRSDIQQYGLCQNCGETDKKARQYRKLVDDNYWMLYKVCSKCGVTFGHTIKGDEGSAFELNEFIELLGTRLIGTQMDDDFKLAKSIVKKIERGEYIPTDQLKMVLKYLEKWTR